MERLDNILKSVATAAVVQITANIKEEEQEVEEEEHQTEVKPPLQIGGRRPSLPLKGEEFKCWTFLRFSRFAHLRSCYLLKVSMLCNEYEELVVLTYLLIYGNRT